MFMETPIADGRPGVGLDPDLSYVYQESTESSVKLGLWAVSAELTIGIAVQLRRGETHD